MGARRKLSIRLKGRWLRACAIFPAVRDSAVQLRLAILLADYHNADLGYAFPSRQTLADGLGVDPTNVSRALRRMVELDMIRVASIRDIPEHMAAWMQRRDRRAHVYALNFDWSERLLAERDYSPLGIMPKQATA
jgi:hypothetical protein